MVSELKVPRLDIKDEIPRPNLSVLLHLLRWLRDSIAEWLHVENSEKSADQNRAPTEPHYVIAEDVGVNVHLSQLAGPSVP